MPARGTIGMALYMGDGASTESFDKVAGVTGLRELMGASANAIDTTTIEDLYRTFMGGLIDPGSVGFDILYDPVDGSHDSATGLLSKMEAAGTTHNFALKFATLNPVQWFAFSGVVTNFAPNANLDDAMRASITIKVSGKPTFSGTAPTGAT